MSDQCLTDVPGNPPFCRIRGRFGKACSPQEMATFWGGSPLGLARNKLVTIAQTQSTETLRLKPLWNNSL